MEGMQIILPVVGIVAAAAVTFYAVSFAEIREKSLRELDEKEERVGFQPSPSSRERRARRQAQKNKSNSNNI